MLESKFEYDRHLSFHQDLSNRCNVCDKGFKHKKALDRHKLIHSSTKSYVCTGCDKTFSRKDHWRRHEFRVHKITETPANVFEEVEEEPDEAVVDEPMVEEPEPVILSLPSTKDSQNPHFVGSIHQLYNSEDITDILKDISSNDINQVIKKMEPRQIKTLRSILSSESSAEAKVPDNNRPIGKKSLLKRYRNQSGVEVDSVDVGGKFPKMNLSMSSGQREAAALALSKWLEANKASEAVTEMEEVRGDRMMEVDREEMPAAETLSRSSTPTNYGERTVIKMTPFGPRKLTIYDGELAE